jgi:NAD(P)H-dependent flavin oxidoreductase YrpB (nitropropane dioxygenase family)
MRAACARRASGTAPDYHGAMTLQERLGIEIPVFCAPMGGGIAGVELVTAISNAGGCGVLGATALPASHLAELIREARRKTQRPFGVGFAIPLLQGGELDAVCADPVAFVWLFWGDAQPYVAKLHAAGMPVMVQVGSVDEARAAAAAAADVIVAQGVEAGGHVRGTEKLDGFLRAVVPALAPVPVIAAGGIADLADARRAAAHGAQGVALGTRFLASHESLASRAYKDRVVAARAQDTVLTKLYDRGWPDATHRVLRTRSYERWLAAGSPAPGARPGEGELVGKARVAGQLVPVPRYAVLPPLEGSEGDVDDYVLYAGESVSRIDDVRPAAEIVRELAPAFLR